MSTNVIFYGWKRSVPGREHLSASHFEEYLSYLAGLQMDGVIESFDPVFLDPNGSGINGFVLIRVDPTRASQLLDRPEFNEHITRSMMHLEDPVLSCGVSGALLEDRMAQWVASIPK
jgi:hypothetical protein